MASFDNYVRCTLCGMVFYREMRNMKKKTAFVIGILGVLLVFGAAVALAQNASDEKTNDAENHECTPEMMENTPENCTGQMMQSGACENMMNGANGCSKITGNSKPAGDKTKENGHCKNMGSGMGSMMDSGANKF